MNSTTVTPAESTATPPKPDPIYDGWVRAEKRQNIVLAFMLVLIVGAEFLRACWWAE